MNHSDLFWMSPKASKSEKQTKTQNKNKDLMRLKSF